MSAEIPGELWLVLRLVLAMFPGAKSFLYIRTFQLLEEYPELKLVLRDLCWQRFLDNSKYQLRR